MFGDGTTASADTLRKTIQVTAKSAEIPSDNNLAGCFSQLTPVTGGVTDCAAFYKVDGNSNVFKIKNGAWRIYTADGEVVTTGTNGTALVVDQKYFLSFDYGIKGTVIDVSANAFPGTWTNIMSALVGNKTILNLSGELLEAA